MADPIEMPDPFLVATYPKFYLDTTGQRTLRTRGGKLVVSDNSVPLWRMELVTAPLTSQEALALEADFFDQLQGSLQSFWGYDFKRYYPGFYPGGVGSTSFTNVVNLEDVSADGRTLTVSGLSAGQKIMKGDYISNRSKLELYRAQNSPTADGSGEIQIQINPPVLEWAVDDSLRFRQASCKMRVIPGSLSMDTQDNIFTSYSFAAIQDLNPEND